MLPTSQLSNEQTKLRFGMESEILHIPPLYEPLSVPKIVHFSVLPCAFLRPPLPCAFLRLPFVCFFVPHRFLGHCYTDRLGHQDTGISGHRDTKIPGHWDTGTLRYRDTGTLGYLDTGTLGHRDTWTLGHWDTRTMGSVQVPTYRNRVVIFSSFSEIVTFCPQY